MPSTSPLPTNMGRPTKFTEERRDKILVALRGGNYRNVAAQWAGVGYSTLASWLARGQDPDAPPEFQEFLEDVLAAEAHAEVADLAAIRSSTSWQARAWRLERRAPERWGKRDALEITGADGGPVQVQLGDGGADRIVALAATLKRRQRELELSDPDVLDQHLVQPGSLSGSAGRGAAVVETTGQDGGAGAGGGSARAESPASVTTESDGSHDAAASVAYGE